MPKDQKAHSGGAQSREGRALRSVILLALPLFSFQRAVLGLVKTGIEKAILVKPVQNLLLSEIQAAMMILDPERKLRNRFGVDLENKINDLADETARKVIAGSLQLVEAQQGVADRIIDVLKALKDGQRPGRAGGA